MALSKYMVFYRASRSARIRLSLKNSGEDDTRMDSKRRRLTLKGFALGGFSLSCKTGKTIISTRLPNHSLGMGMLSRRSSGVITCLNNPVVDV